MRGIPRRTLITAKHMAASISLRLVLSCLWRHCISGTLLSRRVTQEGRADEGAYIHRAILSAVAGHDAQENLALFDAQEVSTARFLRGASTVSGREVSAHASSIPPCYQLNLGVS